MALQTIISPLNPIRFVPLDKVYEYNHRQFDDDWFSASINYWEVQAAYAQKVQKSDNVYIHVLATTQAINIEYKVYDCNRNLVNSQQLTTDGAIAVNDTQVCWLYDISNILSSIDDGIYYITIDVGYDLYGTSSADTYLSFISEPISLKENHPNTVLIEYNNSYSKENLWFEYLNQPLRFRVEGYVGDYEPASERVSFEDQYSEYSQLSATAYRKFKLFLGGNGEPVPDYAIDKVNYLLTCDDIRIEGKSYIQDEGDVSKDSETNYPLYSAVIPLIETNRAGNFIYTKPQLKYGVFNIPAYPFAVWQIKNYINEVSLNFFSPTKYVIHNATELQTLIDNLPTYGTATPDNYNMGLHGSFDIESGAVVYTTNEEDTSPINFITDLTASYFEIGIDAPVVPTTFTVGQIGNDYAWAIAEKVAVPGAGIISSYQVAQGSGSVTYPGVVADNIQFHEIPITYTGNQTIRLWQSDSIRYFAIGGSPFYAHTFNGADMVTSLDGIAPAGLEALDSLDTAITTFNAFSVLNKCQSVIKQVAIENSSLNGVTFYVSPSIRWNKYISLINVYFRNCGFTTHSAVDAIFNDLYQSMTQNNYTVSNGYITLYDLPSGAEPTSASSVARSYLLNLGWTFNW